MKYRELEKLYHDLGEPDVIEVSQQEFEDIIDEMFFYAAPICMSPNLTRKRLLSQEQPLLFQKATIKPVAAIPTS